MGLPIPEDITLFAAGVMSYYGKADVWIMIAVSFVSVMAGDCIMFWLGAHYGRKIARRRFFARFLTEERLSDVQQRLRLKGNKLIFVARFMPGFRAPIFFSAGLLHLPFRLFFFLD